MSQLRDRIWAYFREYYHMPARTPEIDALLDTLYSQEDRMGIMLDLCAMRVVSYLRDKGKDLTPEQQVEEITPIVYETMNLIVRIRNESGWRPIG